MVKAERPSESLVHFCQNTRRHNPEHEIVTAVRTSDVERRHLGVPFIGDMLDRVKGVFLTFISGYVL
jgi:hypothetical protein